MRQSHKSMIAVRINNVFCTLTTREQAPFFQEILVAGMMYIPRCVHHALNLESIEGKEERKIVAFARAYRVRA